MSVPAIRAAKAALRKKMKEVMKNISSEDRIEQSRIITEKLTKSPEWIKANRVSIFLSMANEIQTEAAALLAIRSGKTIFVPLCQEGDMRMLRIRDEEDLNNLPKDSWGIKEPKPIEGRDDALETGGLDLVVCPGVAFTKGGHRLGYGKGYYDKFLTKLRKLPTTPESPRAVTVALAFKQQVLDDVPVTEEDILIDRILTAD